MRKSSLLFFCVLLSPGVLPAQLVSFGIIAGAPFTDVVHKSSDLTSVCLNGCADQSARYTLGLSVRIGLPRNFRIEVDAVYRPYRFTEFGGDGYRASVSAEEWSLPILLQYRLGGRLLRPFIEGGASFEHLAGLSDDASGSLMAAAARRSVAGAVIGAGIDLSIPIVHVSAEIRFTRQLDSWFQNASQLNQAEVLFGVRF